MVYKKAASPGEVHKTNLPAFKAWVRKNGKLIKAKPGKTVFYTGESIDLLIKKIEKMHAEQVKVIQAETKASKKKRLDKAAQTKTGVWKQLEAAKKDLDTAKKDLVNAKKTLEKLKLPQGFEDINTVLRRIKSHPPLVDRDENEKQFAHMKEYMDEIKRLSDLFPKPEVAKAWTLLSQHFAKNAQGDIKVLDGVEQDFRNVGGHKDFVKQELPALLNNPSISEKGREDLKKLAGKYMSEFSAETRKTVKAALDESDKLKNPK